MIQKAFKHLNAFLTKHVELFWERSTLALGLIICLILPHLAVYAVAPYATLRVFRKGELRSLGLFAAIGLVFDGMSSANFFGFYTVLLPVVGAFIYSLKHFFQLNVKSAGIFCLLFSFIITLSDMLTVHFFLEAPLLGFFEYLAFLGIYPALFAFVCMRLLRVEQKLIALS